LTTVNSFDDATFGTIDGVGFGDFHREDRSILHAASTAIAQVDSVPGLLLVRIESEDLVTMAGIARACIDRARASASSPPTRADQEGSRLRLPGSDRAHRCGDGSTWRRGRSERSGARIPMPG
jgi:hypothetical protein